MTNHVPLTDDAIITELIKPDYRDLVTIGLFVDVLAACRAHDLDWADDDPRRRALALVALSGFADAMAGEL